MSKPCTPQEVMRIRTLYAEGWSQGRLAREFRRTVGTIGRIVRGETHQELPSISKEEDIAAAAAEAQKRFQEIVQKDLTKVEERFFADLDKQQQLNTDLKELILERMKK